MARLPRYVLARSRFIFCAIDAIDPGFYLMTLNNASRDGVKTASITA